MINTVRSEWTKLFTTRTWIGLLVGACVMAGGFAAWPMWSTAIMGNMPGACPSRTC